MFKTTDDAEAPDHQSFNEHSNQSARSDVCGTDGAVNIWRGFRSQQDHVSPVKRQWIHF